MQDPIPVYRNDECEGFLDLSKTELLGETCYFDVNDPDEYPSGVELHRSNGGSIFIVSWFCDEIECRRVRERASIAAMSEVSNLLAESGFDPTLALFSHQDLARTYFVRRRLSPPPEMMTQLGLVDFSAPASRQQAPHTDHKREQETSGEVQPPSPARMVSDAPNGPTEIGGRAFIWDGHRYPFAAGVDWGILNYVWKRGGLRARVPIDDLLRDWPGGKLNKKTARKTAQSRMSDVNNILKRWPNMPHRLKLDDMDNVVWEKAEDSSKPSDTLPLRHAC